MLCQHVFFFRIFSFSPLSLNFMHKISPFFLCPSILRTFSLQILLNMLLQIYFLVIFFLIISFFKQSFYSVAVSCVFCFFHISINEYLKSQTCWLAFIELTSTEVRTCQKCALSLFFIVAFPSKNQSFYSHHTTLFRLLAFPLLSITYFFHLPQYSKVSVAVFFLLSLSL